MIFDLIPKLAYFQDTIINLFITLTLFTLLSAHLFWDTEGLYSYLHLNYLKKKQQPNLSLIILS